MLSCRYSCAELGFSHSGPNVLNTHNVLKVLMRVKTCSVDESPAIMNAILLVSELRLCVINAAPSEARDGDLLLITEPALLTRCA